MDSNASETASASPAFYLLGFSLNGDSLESGDLALLDHLGVQHTTSLAVTAWYKVIERSEFEGPIAEKNLADIQWLTPRVLAHETIVSNLSQRIPFYPSRFGALFSSIEKITHHTCLNASILKEFLSAVRGKEEWGIKFYSDNARAAQIAASHEGIVEDGKPTSGVNYLKLRQLQRSLSLTSSETIQAKVTTAIGYLQSQYADVVSRPIFNAKESSAEKLLANIALLVCRDASTAFLDWTRRWNAEQYLASSIRLQVTGPWPAYSFCPTLASLTEQSEAA